LLEIIELSMCFNPFFELFFLENTLHDIFSVAKLQQIHEIGRKIMLNLIKSRYWLTFCKENMKYAFLLI